MAPFTQEVTLVRRTKGTVTDAFGNDTWAEVAVTVPGIFVPGGSTEQIQGQDLLVTQPTVYLPAGTDVGYLDAVIVAGDRYDVDGSPNAYVNPFTGWAPGIEVRLRRATG